MTIGEKIKYYREMHGFTQEYVATRLGTTPQNIYKYEKGIIKNIPLPSIILLSELFGISPASLAGISDESSNDADLVLTETERLVILKYRENPKYTAAIHQLLGISPSDLGASDNDFYYPTLSPTYLEGAKMRTKVAQPLSKYDTSGPKNEKK